MSADLVFALDVGGTYVKGCVVARGEVLEGTVSQYAAGAKDSEEAIIGGLSDILRDLLEQYKRHPNAETVGVIGIGMSFPGPFDYERGICWIRGLDKFESLYGVNVKEKLLQSLQASGFGGSPESLDIRFQNDGRLFGLGAGKKYPDERLLAITLGTGIGSAFIERGALVTEGDRVPAEGYLYCLPYQGAVADECFSRRGILGLFRDAGCLHDGMDVKELAELARKGGVREKELFAKFGEELGQFLLPFLTDFKADRLIIGGQIAKSIDLFGEGLHRHLTPSGIRIESLGNALYHTFIGASCLFNSKSLKG
ncbi:ROK family protein [Paenibacillus sp. LHD-117]|uniref:ROK family protein n=1 Tax=Paenibacillus sp. LHD-117 TaxID=3071412 RepID=UPI0027DEBB72|nr:ROK family protein [Paenibacillus sp. LHD-117]MDQ6417960.1 ROK family protein [Paenibacillus sp. LHD-117]